MSSSVLCPSTHSAYDISSVWGTKFHTSIKQQAKLQSCTVWFLYFEIANRKAKNSALSNDSHFLSYSLHLIYFWTQFKFLCSQIFELCRNFTGFITVLHVVILYCIFFMRHEHIHSFLSIYFLSSLLNGGVVRLSCFNLQYLCFHPINIHHQHRLECYVPQSISVSPRLLRPI